MGAKIYNKKISDMDITPEKSFEKSASFVVTSPYKIDVNADESVAEIASDDRLAREDLLASVNHAHRYDYDSLRGANAYASLENYQQNDFADAYRSTNEKVKSDLAMIFFSNPEQHAARAINSILEDLNASYILTEEEMDILKNKSKNEDRREYVAELRRKTEQVDIEFIQAVEAIDGIMQALEATERVKEGTFADSASILLKKKVSDAIREFGLKDLTLEKQEKIVNTICAGGEAPCTLDEFSRFLKKNNISADNISDESKFEILKGTIVSAKELHSNLNNSIRLASSINYDVRQQKYFIDIVDNFKKLDSEKYIKDILTELREKYPKDAKENSFNGLLIKADRLNGTKFAEQLHDGTMSKESIKQMLAGALGGVVLDGINERLGEKAQTQFGKQVIENYKELANTISGGKIGREKGKDFTWQEIADSYDEFMEKNIKDAVFSVEDNGQNGGLVKEMQSLLKDGAEIFPHFTQETRDRAIEIMNFNNMTSNTKTLSNIQKDEIVDVVKQSLTNPALKHNAEKILNTKKDKELNPDVKRDISARQKGEELTAIAYFDYANGLNKRLFTLASSADALQQFRSCLEGSSIQKTQMSTVSSNVSGCLDKFKEHITREAERLDGIVASSLHGVGALNPFAGLMLLVAEYRKFRAYSIERNVEQINKDIAGILKEVSSGADEMTRHARYNLKKAETNNGIATTGVHVSELTNYKMAVQKEALVKELLGPEAKKEAILEQLKMPKLSIKERLTLSEDEIQKRINDEKKRIDAFENSWALKKHELRNGYPDNHHGKQKDLLSDNIQNGLISAVTGSIGIEVGLVDVFSNELQTDSLAQDFSEGFTDETGNEKKNGDTKKDNSKKTYTVGELAFMLRAAEQKELELLKISILGGGIAQSVGEENYAGAETEEATLGRRLDEAHKMKLELRDELLKASLDELNNNAEQYEAYQPKEKLKKIKEEVDKVFDINSTASPLDKLNALSDAIAVLGKSGPAMKVALDSLLATSGTTVDTVVNDNKMAAVTSLTGEKSLLLKLYQEAAPYKDKTEYSSEEQRMQIQESNLVFSIIDTKLLEGTNLPEARNELRNYSEYKESKNEIVRGESTIKNVNDIYKQEHISNHINNAKL